jgi:hypothetical protein
MPNWDRKLGRVLTPMDGKPPRTLQDAGDYMLALPPGPL